MSRDLSLSNKFNPAPLLKPPCFQGLKCYVSASYNQIKTIHTIFEIFFTQTGTVHDIVSVVDKNIAIHLHT